VNKKLLGLFLCLALVMAFTTFGLAQQARPSYAATAAAHEATPYVDADAALKKLYSNLGPDPADLYYATNGYFVSGPQNLLNDQKQDVAMPFKVHSNTSIVRVKAALKYYGYGANAAQLAIYSDASGLPGTKIRNKNLTNLDDFGGCCKLAVWNLTTPLPVTKGTTYWIVGTTATPSMDSVSVWDWVYNGFSGTIAFQLDDTGWFLFNSGYPLSAFAVFGQ